MLNNLLTPLDKDNKSEYIMLDLETLGTSALAPVIECAMVEFDMLGRTNGEFTVKVQPDFNISRPDFSTIQWWSQQSDIARKTVLEGKARSNYHGMCDLIDRFMLGRQDHKIWCHATFDAPIIETVYAQLGRPRPWSHRNICDIRTLTYLVPGAETARVGTAHTAMGDCLSQIKYVTTMLNLIKGS